MTTANPITSFKSSGLVYLSQDNTLVTGSRYIAEYFGTRHDDVLRKVRALNCSRDFNARNFAEVEYKDQKGELRMLTI